MACSMLKDLMVGFHPPEKVAAKPSAAYPLDESPLSPAWTTTVIPASSASPQNASKLESKGLRRPVLVTGAAGRITTLWAPWSRAHCNSSAAHDGSARVT